MVGLSLIYFCISTSLKINLLQSNLLFSGCGFSKVFNSRVKKFFQVNKSNQLNLVNVKKITKAPYFYLKMEINLASFKAIFILKNKNGIPKIL